MKAKKATVALDLVEGLSQFLAEVTYFIVSLLRLSIMTGGVWAANIIDIGLGGVVWYLVIQDQTSEMLPPIITGGIGILISLVTTRAQIHFNQQLIAGDTIEEPDTIRRTLYMAFNFLLSLADTIVDGSLAVYLFFLRSPMDLFEVIREGVPGMFWLFFFLLMAVSMFGDVINIMYLREQERSYQTRNPRLNYKKERLSNTYATTNRRTVPLYTPAKRNDSDGRAIPASKSTPDLDAALRGIFNNSDESQRLPIYPSNISRISRNMDKQPLDGSDFLSKK